MKVLSVIVPVYNTEAYLPRCLDSLLYAKECAKSLEIILVNDGSKDGSLKLMRSYQKAYPDTIKVIDKQNGGHGSTINAGIKIATGKYLKVIDSDDWANIIDLPKLAERLKAEVSDLVICNYIKDILYDNSAQKFDFYSDKESGVHRISELADHINEDDFFFRVSMHSLVVKLAPLKKIWEDLDEKTFYVDQEFVALSLFSAKTYTTYDLDIYRYFIGRPEQSVAADGYYRNRLNHEKVLRRLISFLGEIKDESLRKIIILQISLMLNTHYGIYLSRSQLKSIEKKEILSFDSFLKNNHRALYDEWRDKKNMRPRIHFAKVRNSSVARFAWKLSSSVKNKAGKRSKKSKGGKI